MASCAEWTLVLGTSTRRNLPRGSSSTWHKAFQMDSVRNLSRPLSLFKSRFWSPPDHLFSSNNHLLAFFPVPDCRFEASCAYKGLRTKRVHVQMHAVQLFGFQWQNVDFIVGHHWYWKGVVVLWCTYLKTLTSCCILLESQISSWNRAGRPKGPRFQIQSSKTGNEVILHRHWAPASAADWKQKQLYQNPIATKNHGTWFKQSKNLVAHIVCKKFRDNKTQTQPRLWN